MVIFKNTKESVQANKYIIMEIALKAVGKGKFIVSNKRSRCLIVQASEQYWDQRVCERPNREVHYAAAQISLRPIAVSELEPSHVAIEASTLPLDGPVAWCHGADKDRQ